MFINRKILGPIFKRLSPFIKDDELYLKWLYRSYMGRKLDLVNPQLYQEKLQWLKLYDRKPYYPQMVDKVTVKKIVEDKIGEQYIIPTLGIWDSFDKIDFDRLPEQFVLKSSNGSGGDGVIICKDRKKMDMKEAKEKIERSMRGSEYNSYREWPYKKIKPLILAERYLEDNSEYNISGLTDYKFTCFNGYADNVMVCTGRQRGDTKFYFFDRQWKLLPLNVRGKETDPKFQLPKPERIEEMFEIAGVLSEGIPFLRVDFYYINHQPFFGELTFYPASGLDPNILPETEIYFGNKIILPKKNAYE